MKKIALALLTVLGVMFGSALSASAADSYPPGATITVDAPGPAAPAAPGATFNVLVKNVTPGTSVSITIDGKTYKGTAAANGVATVGVVAPASAGSYPLTVVAGTTTVPGYSLAVGVLATTTTVAATTTTAKPTNTVPATGSNTTFTGMAIGVPLLVGGLALLIVSRRRRPISA